MFRRTGAIIVLLIMFLIAGEIGNTLGQALTIFGIFMWVIAAGMVTYLVLFRGMKLSLFKRSVESQPANDELDVDPVEHESPSARDNG